MTYRIYLVHFGFTSWVQYALLEVPLHAIPKGLLAMLAILALSWASVAALRRIPAVARVI